MSMEIQPWFDSYLWKTINTLASIVTFLAAATGIIRYLLKRKKQDQLNVDIKLMFFYMFRIGVSAIVCLMLLGLANVLRLLIAEGVSDNNIGKNLYWDNNFPISSFISLFITILIALPIMFWICMFIIKARIPKWSDFTSLFSTRKQFKNHLREEYPLEIIEATYGKGDKVVNVKSILEDKIENNSLQVAASNDNFGDPAKMVEKELFIKWRYGNAEASITISEHKTVNITKGNTPEYIEGTPSNNII